VRSAQALALPSAQGSSRIVYSYWRLVGMVGTVIDG
jgi:hypothetical protein